LYIQQKFKNKGEKMEYVVRNTFDIRNFNFWGGARDRIQEARELDVLDELEELIEMSFCDEPTDTQINDFVWFEIDDWLREKRQEILSDLTVVEEADFDLDVEVTGIYASDAVEVMEKATKHDCATELLGYLKSSISFPATHDEITEAIADANDWLDEKIEENEEANEEE
jgi:hypothetical protein